MVRENRGHALETVSEIHPYEVDQISKGDKRQDKYTQLWKEGMTCVGSDADCHQRNNRHWVPTKPTVFFIDGRATNQLTAGDFQRDPCHFYRNIFPWKPVGPKSFIPVSGHYQGLGKPPVRKYFQITPKQVHHTRVMPTYEVYTPASACHYYKDTV